MAILVDIPIMFGHTHIVSEGGDPNTNNHVVRFLRAARGSGAIGDRHGRSPTGGASWAGAEEPNGLE